MRGSRHLDMVCGCTVRSEGVEERNVRRKSKLRLWAHRSGGEGGRAKQANKRHASVDGGLK